MLLEKIWRLNLILTVGITLSSSVLALLLTLRPDRLGNGAGVTEAVRVDCSDNKKINSVGEESDDCVPLVLHMVRHCLPGTAH